LGAGDSSLVRVVSCVLGSLWKKPEGGDLCRALGGYAPFGEAFRCRDLGTPAVEGGEAPGGAKKLFAQRKIGVGTVFVDQGEEQPTRLLVRSRGSPQSTFR
jgi:hypothetical protein